METKQKLVTTKIAIFQKNEVRKVIYNNEWWFSVADVVQALTDSVDVKQYIKRMRQRDLEINSYWGTICTPLEMKAKDGKKRKITSANTEGIFRIIQSITSPKAEPFKRWLAKVGYERVQEIEDPELATKRTRMLYKAKGYSDGWIEKRLRGIVIREELTDQWQERGANNKKDYAILTAEISKATFGVTPNQYKKLKKLDRENLRDHMNDFELIFNMLGERATTEIHRNENSQGVSKLKSDAKAGGDIAGGARKELEKKLGRSVVSEENYLEKKEKEKQLN
ncbi:MAG: Bro-N domain-containing protein [Candidatus Pacebacteria bacterium]|nr:Bro-N domain-containing protein [Candidatus Paceibacterota bacterium]